MQDKRRLRLVTDLGNGEGSIEGWDRVPLGFDFTLEAESDRGIGRVIQLALERGDSLLAIAFPCVADFFGDKIALNATGTPTPAPFFGSMIYLYIKYYYEKSYKIK